MNANKIGRTGMDYNSAKQKFCGNIKGRPTSNTGWQWAAKAEKAMKTRLSRLGYHVQNFTEFMGWGERNVLCLFFKLHILFSTIVFERKLKLVIRMLETVCPGFKHMVFYLFRLPFANNMHQSILALL